MAADAEGRQLSIERVIAVSPVLDPAVTMLTLERGMPVYHAYFVRKWSRSLRRKRALWPGAKGMDERFFRLRNLRRMTAEMVAGHTEFPDIGAYLDGYAITGDRLATLHAPATILAALDDPIIPAEDLQRLAPSAQLKVVAVPSGGHMGFLVHPWRESWVIDFVMEELGLARAAGA